MKTIDEIQTEFVTAFNEIDDWMMQYEFLLQVGAELEPYPDKWRDDTHLIQGCQSKVWIHCEEQDGRLHIWGGTDHQGNHCSCYCYVSGSEKGRYCRCKGVVYRGYRFEKSDQHRSVQRCEQCDPAYTVHLSVKPDKLAGDQL